MKQLSEDTLQELARSVENLESANVETVTTKALDEGLKPDQILEDGLVKGLKEIGRKFETREVFLVEMMMAADAFKAGLGILEPYLSERRGKTTSVFVLGTVAGDIHNLGKDLVSAMLTASGFDVRDLGVDVPVYKFVEAAKNMKPRIIGASALMTTTVVEQKKIVDALASANLRQSVKFMVGGAAVSERWAKEIGADGWATGLQDAIKRSIQCAHV